MPHLVDVILIVLLFVALALIVWIDGKLEHKGKKH